MAIVPELPNVSAVGETPEQAVEEVKIAAQLYIELMEEEKVAVPEPNQLAEYSGQLRLRMPKSLHARLATQARIEGVSLNSYLVYLLSEGEKPEEHSKPKAKAVHG